MNQCKRTTYHSAGYTLFDAVASITIVALVVALFTGTISRNRKAQTMLASGHQLRGIHQGLIISGLSNNTYYPGLDANGNDKNPAVADRFHQMILERMFDSYYTIHPNDTFAKPWTSGPFTSSHYSFTMSSLTGDGARRSEWRQTNNQDAPVVADPFGGSKDQPMTIGTNDPWLGIVAWNDNHVTGEFSATVSTINADVATRFDHLFLAASDDDAMMVHEGK